MIVCQYCGSYLVYKQFGSQINPTGWWECPYWEVDTRHPYGVPPQQVQPFQCW